MNCRNSISTTKNSLVAQAQAADLSYDRSPGEYGYQATNVAAVDAVHAMDVLKKDKEQQDAVRQLRRP